MKIRITLVIFFLIELGIPSCSKKIYMGTYSSSIPDASFEAFRLSSDSCFEYTFRSGWNKSNSSGLWSKHGRNEIILNSQYKRNSIPLRVIAMQKNTSGYTFKFMKYYSRKENPNFWEVLIINNKDSFKVEDSIMKLKYPGELKSFKMQIVTTEYLNDSIGMNKLVTKNYMVQSKKENEFILNYPFEWNMSYYRDFDNEKLIIKHKSLYWPLKQKLFKWRPTISARL